MYLYEAFLFFVCVWANNTNKIIQEETNLTDQ